MKERKVKQLKVKQLTVKCTESQMDELVNLAEQKGGQPLSFLIREAIAEYLERHKVLR